MVLRKAYNTLNECVALKSPLFYEDGIKEMEYKETSQEALQRYEEVQTLLTLEEQAFSNKSIPAVLIYVSLTWEALRTSKQIPRLPPLNMASGVTEQLSMPHLKCSPAM